MLSEICQSKGLEANFKDKKSPDGLFGVLKMLCGFCRRLIYKINKTGLDWASGVYLENVSDDTEKDIVVQTEERKYRIMEIKSFSTDVRLRTKKENIKQLMIQVLKHLRSYKMQNILVDTLYLVTNYFSDDETEQIVNELLSNTNFAELKEINLEIIGPNNIQYLKI